MAVIDDLPATYHEYLARFASELPDVKIGAFAKWSGRLIKKLAFEEFTPAFLEYRELRAQYVESLERGDTINDVQLRVLRENAASMILPPPG